MVQTPKILLLGTDGNPNIKYELGDDSIVSQIVQKGCKVLKVRNLNVIDNFDVRRHKSLSVATIRYEARDGHFLRMQIIARAVSFFGLF